MKRLKNIRQLVVLPHYHLLSIVLALLIWIVGWFTLLSQSLHTIRDFFDTQTTDRLGGDLTIQGSSSLTHEQFQQIEKILAPYDANATTSQTIRFFTSLMIGTGDPLLTTIIGVDDAYPLYGQLILTGMKTGQVWITPALAGAIGDDTQIKIGEQLFTIGGIIEQMPGAGISIFDSGRTIIMPLELIEETALVQVGSRVSYRTAYRIDTDRIESIADEIGKILPGQEIETALNTREQLEQFFDQLTSVIVFALCALIILTYIGISLTNTILIQKLVPTIHLLRLLGLTKKRLIRSGVALTTLLLISAFLLGGSLGYRGWKLLPRGQFDVIPVRDRGVIIRIICITIAIVGAVMLSWGVFLRDEIATNPSIFTLSTSRKNRSSGLIVGGVLLGALLTELGLSRSSLWLSIALIGVLLGAYRSISRLISWLATKTHTLKQSSLGRWRTIRRSSQPGSPMALIVTIMTLLLIIIGSARLFRSALQQYIDKFASDEQANTFILNIRSADRAQISAILEKDLIYFDVILGRILSIDGISLSETIQQRQLRPGSYTREFNMTTVQTADAIVSGRSSGYVLASGEVSIDSRVADALGIEIDDTIRMSIVGREFDLRVVQLRRTTRDGIKPFFFFQLSAAQFVDAPRNYFTVLSLPTTERPRLLKQLLENIGAHFSFIEVDAIIAQIQQILAAIAGAVLLVFSSVAICGGMIFLFCLRYIRREHRTDLGLLHILGAGERFAENSSRATSLYPLLLSGGLAVCGVILVGLILRLTQDTISFSLITILQTAGYLLGGVVIFGGVIWLGRK